MGEGTPFRRPFDCGTSQFVLRRLRERPAVRWPPAPLGHRTNEKNPCPTYRPQSIFSGAGVSSIPAGGTDRNWALAPAKRLRTVQPGSPGLRANYVKPSNGEGRRGLTICAAQAFVANACAAIKRNQPGASAIWPVSRNIPAGGHDMDGGACPAS